MKTNETKETPNTILKHIKNEVSKALNATESALDFLTKQRYTNIPVLDSALNIVPKAVMVGWVLHLLAGGDPSIYRTLKQVESGINPYKNEQRIVCADERPVLKEAPYRYELPEQGERK